jgi:ABC-type branched-subunit amino acid transport system ATPase component/ABC-type branched-subunit amino acid transport system permease subunit
VSSTVVRRIFLMIALVGLVLFPLLSDSLYYENVLILTFLLAIGASGWNIMGGYAGYISIGNSAFIGLGAYTTGILAAKHDLSPFIGCLVGGLVSAAAAALLSLVTRRTRGMYFVIVTFSALQLLGVITTTWTGLTGGSRGLAMPLPTWSLDYRNWPIYYPMLAVLVITVAMSALVHHSKLGLGLLAIQDDEDKATGLGLRTSLYKMIAFVLGGSFLGIAGGLYAYYVTFLNPTGVFDVVTSILIVLAALIGGRGTLWGPVLGAFIIEPLANLTSTSFGGANAGAIRLLLFGSLLGGVVLFLPKGIVPTFVRSRSLRTQRRSLECGEVELMTKSFETLFMSHRFKDGRHDRAALLKVTALHKAFGGLPAVDHVDMTVGQDSITGLIGPNGSGKTTLFNLIDGTVRAQNGHISLMGRPIERRGRASRAHAGLARTYQMPRLFSSLTVVENLVVPETTFNIARLCSARVTTAERGRAIAMLDVLGLTAYADTSPGDLSYGQRKLVELAQVLWADPLLVMLDEPAAGISPALSKRLSDLIQSLHASGVGVLLVEHDLAFLANLCEHVYVMANGRIITQGSVAEISADQAVIDAYLGDSMAMASVRLNA